MTSLLSAARRPKKAEQPAVPAGQQAPRMMVIPADPTPFCQVAERQAA